MARSSDKTAAPPRPEASGGDDLVLRDESDQIISDLRAQLASLQDELAVYRKGDNGEPAPPAAGGEPAVREIVWKDDFAPQVISRLQGPSQELTARLDRVIEQMEDPVLREELERCRQTAYYLFETFRQISDHHRLLLDSIAEARSEIDLTAFRERLVREFAAAGAPIPVETAGELPPDAQLPEAAPAVLSTVARIAGQLIGEVVRIEVAPGDAGDRAGICMTVACTGLREGLDNVQNVAQVVFRPGVSAITVVDWLYMEKIVELQGGSLTLYHEHGRARGFRVVLPR